jgi:transcriptional regulator with XRE-family HTH domain
MWHNYGTSRGAGVAVIRQTRILIHVPLTVRNLRQLRERAVLTQAQLAQAAGLSRHTVQRLEAGAPAVYPTTIQKLAKALKVKPTDLTSDMGA